jgi:hypothetical protein
MEVVSMRSFLLVLGLSVLSAGCSGTTSLVMSSEMANRLYPGRPQTVAGFHQVRVYLTRETVLGLTADRRR